jgi:hypothetical protein
MNRQGFGRKRPWLSLYLHLPEGTEEIHEEYSVAISDAAAEICTQHLPNMNLQP